jgi:hypothetical protein
MSPNRKIPLSLITVFILDLTLPYLPIQNKLYLVCGLSIVQTILIPFFATRLLTTDIKSLFHIKSQKITGTFIGAIYGGILPMVPAILIILANILFPKIAIYLGPFFKFEGLSSQSGGLYLLLILSWIYLIIAGAIIGLISSLTLSQSIDKK